MGWHVYSVDGIGNWKDNGYAWSPRDYQKIFCYAGTTTCTQWYKMERPSVVLQDGHPTHITWAVSDVDKDNQVLPGTNHGAKVVVVPFDGVTFDNDFGVGGGSAGTGGATAGGASSTAGTGGDRATAGRRAVRIPTLAPMPEVAVVELRAVQRRQTHSHCSAFSASCAGGAPTAECARAYGLEFTASGAGA